VGVDHFNKNLSQYVPRIISSALPKKNRLMRWLKLSVSGPAS